MTPDEFRQRVLPQVVAAWDAGCFCRSGGFRKLVSFNFRDYGTGPLGLADAEILIGAIVREKFARRREPTSEQGQVTHYHRCPQCGASCTELYEDFNIHMYCSYVTFEDQGPPAAGVGHYLVGFYGFGLDDFAKVTDFRRTESIEEFVGQLTEQVSR
jgi:hypothetical protein